MVGVGVGGWLIMWIGGEGAWTCTWLSGGDVLFCCTIGSGLVVEVPGLVTGFMVRLVAGLLVGWLPWLLLWLLPWLLPWLLVGLFGFQLGLLGWLLLVACVLLLALLLLVIWKVASLADPSIALGLFSSFCLWAMWNSCFSRSYLCLSSNAICSNLAFVSGSANAQRLLSSLAQSPTRIPGLRARTLPLSSLENHMKAG